jgi:hypothetical protein
VITWQPATLRDDSDVLTCFDGTVTDVFRWCCRIAGSAAGESATAAVYAGLVAEIRRDGLIHVDAARLLADGLAATGSAEVGGLSPLDRALLELTVVDRAPEALVAEVTGLVIAQVAAASAAAVRRLDAGAPGSSADEVLRRDERWLDDATRASCRAAIVGATATRTDDGSPRGGLARPRRRRRTRRTAFVTVVAVLAVVAAGVVAVAGATALFGDAQGGGGSAERPVPVTAGPAPVLLQPPGFVLGGPGRGFTVSGVVERIAPDLPRGWLQLWASPGASRTGGRWFSVLTARCAAFAAVADTSSTTVSVDGRPALLTTSADGVLTVSRQRGSDPATASTLEVTGHGFADGDLIRIAESVVAAFDVKDPTETPDDDCSTGRPAGPASFTTAFADLHPGMSEIAAGPVFANTLTTVREHATERSIVYDVGGSATLTITTRGHDAVLGAAFELLTDVQRGSPDRAVIGSRVVAIGQHSDADDAPVVTVLEWTDGDSDVTMTSELPLDDMLELVHDVRPAAIEEWTGRG